MGKFENLNTFATIAKTGSFQAAGKALGLTSTAVSKQLTTLEQALGLKLLKRSAHGIHLTQAGKEVLSEAHAMQAIHHNIESLSETYANHPVGTLRVHSTVDFANLFIIPYINTFIDENPHVLVDLDISDREPNLKKENLDISFALFVVGNMMLSPDVVRARLFESHMGLYASTGYIKRFGEPKNLDDLKSHRIILHRGERAAPMNALSVKPGFLTVEPILYLNSTEAILKCALNNIGIAQLPEFAVLDHLASGQLRPILTEQHDKKRPLYYHYLENKLILPKVKRFIQFLKHQIKQTTKLNEK